MAFFDSTLAALVDDRTVYCTPLAWFDFATTPMRLWPGAGTLTTNDSNTWSGIGEYGSIDGIEQAIAGNAPKATFTLSGVSTWLLTDAKAAASEVKNRDCIVYLQFFDDQGAPTDNPVAIFSGIMDQVTYSATGPSQRVVTVSAESLFTFRKRPPFGLYTDRDQNARFSGDRGLEQIPDLVNKTIRWV